MSFSHETLGGSFNSREDAMTSLRQLNAFSDDGIQNVTVTPLRGGFLFEVCSVLRPVSTLLQASRARSIDRSINRCPSLRWWAGGRFSDCHCVGGMVCPMGVVASIHRAVLPAASLPVALFVSFLSRKQSGRARRPSSRASGAVGRRSSA